VTYSPRIRNFGVSDSNLLLILAIAGLEECEMTEYPSVLSGDGKDLVGCDVELFINEMELLMISGY